MLSKLCSAGLECTADAQRPRALDGMGPAVETLGRLDGAAKGHHTRQSINLGMDRLGAHQRRDEVLGLLHEHVMGWHQGAAAGQTSSERSSSCSRRDVVMRV